MFDPDSNKIDESELQDEKHDLHKCATDDGTTIVVNPESKNAHSSIRCKFDPVSNEIDESEPHRAKHDWHKTEIEHEIQDRCPDRTTFITLLNSSIIPSLTVLLRAKSDAICACAEAAERIPSILIDD
jgi:hypothetical protein